MGLNFLGNEKIDVTIRPVRKGYRLLLTQKAREGYRVRNDYYSPLRKFATVDEAKAHAKEYTDKLRVKRERKAKEDADREAALVRYVILL